MALRLSRRCCAVPAQGSPNLLIRTTISDKSALTGPFEPAPTDFSEAPSRRRAVPPWPMASRRAKGETGPWPPPVQSLR